MSTDPKNVAPVVMYSSRFCAYCMMAKRLLERKGVAMDVVEVDADAELRREMVQRSGRTSVPQIFIGDVHVGGCDDLYALDAAGRLDPMLSSAAA